MAGEVSFAGPNANIVVPGNLASGTVVAAAATAAQRVYVGNAGKVEVALISATFSATATTKINLYGILGPARMDGNEGTRTSAPLASATIVSTTTQLSAVVYPFQFVEVEIAPGASSAVTIVGRIVMGTAGPSS